MMEFLNNIIPNVVNKFPEFLLAIKQTLQMAGWSGAYIIVFGIFFGVTITVTKPTGILENKLVYQILDKIINFFRSIPFVILMTGVMPLSRLIMGTAIGLKGAIVPLIVAGIPFFTRQVESVLSDVDKGLVEAAQSMGLSNVGIILRVYLKESIPGIVRGTTIALISLFGLIAMAGAVGAGGLGDFVIRFGHDRNMTDITYVSIIVLVLMISIVQGLGNTIARKNTH